MLENTHTEKTKANLAKESAQALRATSKPIQDCQICGSEEMESVLFVGYIPPVNKMPKVGSVAVEQPTYPLELLRCKSCGLVQIGCEVDQRELFPPDYPYLSGTTRILRDNFAELYRELLTFKNLSPQDLCIDIGSNDGTLLTPFHSGGHRVLGIEPSEASIVANNKGINTRMAFFSKSLAAEVKAEHGQASVITAANVFAHIPDVHGIISGITDLLKPDGFFINESHYLMSLLQTVQYDTIYHEHLRYYSLRVLRDMLAQHGLEVFHAKKIPTHGGSIRVYSARKGLMKVLPSVGEILAEEDRNGVTDGSALVEFKRQVVASKLKTYALLNEIKKPGVRVYGIGAPSRASTLINYLGLDEDSMEAVMEVSTSHKLNKYIPGTRIPVLDERKLYSDQPEYAFFLSWHIAEELAPKLRASGYKGKFIVPLPTPRVMEI